MKQVLNIPQITLDWSDWVSWDIVKTHVRLGGVRIPNQISGVYEVRHEHDEKCLTIGKASDLRMRLRQGLVSGMAPHSAGKAIRENEDVSTIVIRWAVTNRPSAVEEELHRLYKGKHNCLPKYTRHT
jgi:hypothetical protein